MDDSKAGNFASALSRELSLVGTVSDLPRIASFVEEASRAARVRSSLLVDLQLAVEEACCNVFEHAYEDEPGALQLRFEVRARDVVITVLDQGQPFEPDAIPPVDVSVPLEDRPIGGLGIYLIQQLMDEVQYVFSTGGNTLRMVKRNAVVDPGSTEEADERS